jgi:YegS/Rv2252/BmrU family lipid kinase
MPEPSDTLLVVNPRAARAATVFPKLQQRLTAENISFDVHETSSAGDATGAAALALGAGYRTIVAVGGDGTISETAAGFFELSGDLPRSIAPDSVLAIVPAGTGNDLARGLGNDVATTAEDWIELVARYLKTRSVDPASEAVNRFAPAPIDIIYGQSDRGRHRFIVLNASTLGIGPEAAARVGRHSGFTQVLPGSVRFLFAAIAALAKWRERFVNVTIDSGPTLKCQSNLMGASNNRYAGGGMMLAPDARVDDGQLDFLLACGLTRSMVFRELKRIRHGGHVANPCVRIFPASRVRIEAQTPRDELMVEADGNPRGRTPVEYQVIPRALRVLRPELGVVMNELVELPVGSLNASPA